MYVTGNQQGASRDHHRQSFPKNSAQHGTIYLLHNLPHQTEQTNKQQREKGKGKRLAIATITSTVACVSMFLTIYT